MRNSFKKARLWVLLAGIAGSSGCAGISGSRAGLIQNGQWFCNVNDPAGIQGTRRTLIQTNANYANWTPDVRSQLASRIQSALAARSSATLQYDYPAQGPYDLWINMTEYRNIAPGGTAGEQCAAEGMFGDGGAECDKPGNETHWIGVNVSAGGAWMFDLYSPSWDSWNDHGGFDRQFDQMMSTVSSMLASGWKCTSQGRAFQ